MDLNKKLMKSAELEERLLDSIEQRLQQTTHSETLFTLQFSVV